MNRLTWVVASVPYAVALAFWFMPATEKTFVQGFSIGFLLLLFNFLAIVFLVFALIVPKLRIFSSHAYLKLGALALQYPLGVLIYIKIAVQHE